MCCGDGREIPGSVVGWDTHSGEDMGDGKPS